MSLGKLTGFQGSHFVCKGEGGMLVAGVCVSKYVGVLTLVLLRVFPKHIFLRGGLLQPPLWIINIEGHITLNLLPVYRYGHPLSIDTKISTNH